MLLLFLCPRQLRLNLINNLVQNPSFPSVYSAQTALTYTINKCSSDVCSVRLDFESFTTQGPTSTAELLGGACVDSFTATGSSGQTSPVICGMNKGQHSKYTAMERR